VPTPQEVVDEMLRIADVKKGDVLYDLGSGDGRIPITAAKKFGISAVGIDIDPERIREANENAKKARRHRPGRVPPGGPVQGRLPEATVVTLYLLPDLNVKLRPRCGPSSSPARASSRTSSTWAPGSRRRRSSRTGRTVYFWTVPRKEEIAHEAAVIEIASDVVCPGATSASAAWRRRSTCSRASRGSSALAAVPAQPRPAPAGIPRADYRKAKFGSLERSRQMDARVVEEARARASTSPSIACRSSRIPRRLTADRSCRKPNCGRRCAIPRHFEQAREHRRPEVLAEIAAQCGVQGWPEKRRTCRSSKAKCARWASRPCRRSSSSAGTAVSGAYPAPTLADAIRQAATSTV
jgi:predicted DsbA family dithiol-disulfide isomerase